MFDGNKHLLDYRYSRSYRNLEVDQQKTQIGKGTNDDNGLVAMMSLLLDGQEQGRRRLPRTASMLFTDATLSGHIAFPEVCDLAEGTQADAGATDAYA